MRIKELLQEALLLENNIDSILRGYFFHGGADFSKFSMAMIGRGEGNHLLGKGIYFINDEKIALRYTKYAKSSKQSLYQVKLNADSENFYNSMKKPSYFQEVDYNDIAKELGYETFRDMKYNHSIMRDGRGLVGAVFSRLGAINGAKLLNKNGVYGQYEVIEPGVIEIAVWNPEIIKIVKKWSKEDYIEQYGEN